jgi:hypothetical protein
MAVSIRKPEFKRAEFTSPRKLDVIVEALDGVGKTFFGLTAPGPIAIHDFDGGLHRAIQGFSKERLESLELYPFEYDITRTLKLPGEDASRGLVERAADVWTEFVLAARASVDKCRTNVIDTGSAVWELLRLARLGKLTQVMPVQYTQVNLEFKELIQTLHKSPANNVWVHRLKPAYDAQDKKIPNQFDRQGFGDMAFEVDAVLRLTYDDFDGLRLRFGKCANRSLMGTYVTGAENISFAKIASMIYPNTDRKYWE